MADSPFTPCASCSGSCLRVEACALRECPLPGDPPPLKEWAEYERFGRPCLVRDRYLADESRGRIVRDLNDGDLVEVVLDGQSFPDATVRVKRSEVRELANAENLFPEGLPLRERPSWLSA